jgi:hypothetical protein
VVPLAGYVSTPILVTKMQYLNFEDFFRIFVSCKSRIVTLRGHSIDYFDQPSNVEDKILHNWAASNQSVVTLPSIEILNFKSTFGWRELKSNPVGAKSFPEYTQNISHPTET